MISKNQILRKRTQNEPKRTQNKPNHKNAKNGRNCCYNKDLRRKSPAHPPKKQTQNKPKQTQFQPKASPLSLIHRPTTAVQVRPNRYRSNQRENKDAHPGCSFHPLLLEKSLQPKNYKPNSSDNQVVF